MPSNILAPPLPKMVVLPQKSRSGLARQHPPWQSSTEFGEARTSASQQNSSCTNNKTLVVSILLYGCESWTMTAETIKRVQTFEFKCFRRLLNIPWQAHMTNELVLTQITSLAGPQEPLLATVKRRKLSWFGHVTRHNSLPKTILQGTVEGGRKRGRQVKSWMDNIKEWTRMDSPTLIRKAEDRNGWRYLTHKSSFRSPLRPKRSGE